MKSIFVSSGVFALALASQASAQSTVFPDDVIMQRHACVGNACSDPETFADFWQLKLKSADPGVVFEDTDAVDWFIAPDIADQEGLFFGDRTNNKLPFIIDDNSPTSALFISSTDGNIGMGTQLPLRDLHIFSTTTPTLRLEIEPGGIVSPQSWDLAANDTAFFLRDATGLVTLPIIVRTDAPDSSLDIATSGNIGLGTDTPEGKLHTKGNGVQLAYFESGDGGPVQVRFRTDSENRRFLAVDNANNVKTQIIFKDNEILFTGQTDSGANRWLTIGPSGIVSRGPTCNPGPCDATFDPEVFEVPPLKERTAYMWEHQHLWAVGPTKPGEPINLTEKTGAMLHELEVAYIYIEQLHDRLEAESQRNDQLESTVSQMALRLEALEQAED